jgi:hypothetical protein
MRLRYRGRVLAMMVVVHHVDLILMLLLKARSLLVAIEFWLSIAVEK